ncbi:VOC family protein [Streptomyces sp. SID3343]|uniref:VOC family protein n=1 Tax=Streptomyces sp. SID3343 TaxID=2690260 RepID=UPI00137004E3|nr:VOC family protein [Streptomyces sp. SID3343]MYW06627.1 VOC family protein [Streptomyces sp. SID3343]
MSDWNAPYPTGVPCWVDLTVPDVEAGLAFYRGLFGWEATIGPAELGYYTSCTLGGRMVAGVGGRMPDQEGPPEWTIHFAAEDADDVARRIGEAGGTVVLPPMDVMTFGRMALATDPTGATFGLWQAGDHRGAGVVNEPGAVVWNELYTPDSARAKQFYTSVFDFSYDDMSDADFDYATFKVRGELRGGIAGARNGPPPHWATYFAVGDADETVDRVDDLGGKILRGPEESPYGRVAAVQDPQGAVFNVIAVASDPNSPE